MFSHYLYLFYVWQQKICKWEQLYWAFSYIKVCNSLESRKVLKCQKLSECKPDAVRVLLVVLVYLIVSTWSSCALLLYIVPLSLMSLLVHCVSSLCVREFLVSQLVILVVLYFTLLVSLALHLVLLKFIRFPLLLLFCSSLVPVFSFFKPLVWFLSLFRFFCLSQFLFQLSIPSICLLVHFLVLFALCSLNLFFFVLFFLVIVCSECLILLLMVSLVVLSCVLCFVLFVPVLCPDSPWLLFSRPGYLTGLGSLQLKVSSPGCSSCCLISSVLIDWCCSISFVLQPNFVQVWLQPSSCSPADCPFLLFGLSHQPC